MSAQSTHSGLHWFDGHLDLAFLAEQGRDLEKSADECGGGLQPASVTFPALAAGNVRAAFGTIFIQQRPTEEEARAQNIDDVSGPWYFDDAEGAHRAALRQLDIYQRWHERGLITLAHKIVVPEARPQSMRVTILMEGASGLRTPADFQLFYDRGVRIVGLTWVDSNHFAGGNNSVMGEGDVTPMGRTLLKELDRLRCVHDVSHLSERAFWTVLASTTSRKIASHSNCRALLPGKEHPQRHLSDDQIRALAEVRAIIGINLFSPFLVPGQSERAAIADVLQHIHHMEQLAGRRDFLALGSDFDGGFGRDRACAGLDGPEHLHRLAEALASAGWSDAEIHRFAWQNWADLVG